MEKGDRAVIARVSCEGIVLLFDLQEGISKNLRLEVATTWKENLMMIFLLLPRRERDKGYAEVYG